MYSVKIIEAIISLFLIAVLIVCIIFSYKGSYIQNTDNESPVEEVQNQETENNSVSSPEKVDDSKDKAPATEVPFIENDYHPGGSFTGTVIEETSQYMIVEPIEPEEHSFSSTVTVVYPEERIYYLYCIGTKVYINYSVIEPNTPYIKMVTDDITVISE